VCSCCVLFTISIMPHTRPQLFRRVSRLATPVFGTRLELLFLSVRRTYLVCGPAAGQIEQLRKRQSRIEATAILAGGNREGGNDEPVRVVCAGHGIELNLFYWWRRRLAVASVNSNWVLPHIPCRSRGSV